MKKENILLLLLFLSIVLIRENVFAWVGKYNYAVESFTVEDNFAYVSGWGILNGRSGDAGTGSRVNERSSGEAKRNTTASERIYRTAAHSFQNGYCKYGSTAYTYNKEKASGSGSHDEGYTYKYALKVYKVNNDGSTTEVQNAVEKLKPVGVTSLTYHQATKVNGNGPAIMGDSTNACYEDVGFRFKIDLSKLVAAKGVKGYKMTLTISAGDKKNCEASLKDKDSANVSYRGGYCSQTFDLRVVIPGTSSTSSYINGEYLKDTTDKVQILPCGSAKMWKNAGFSESKVGSDLSCINKGTKYEVLDTTKNDNITWYKIKHGGKTGWVPASWVNPTGEVSLITIPEEETPELEKVAQCTKQTIEAVEKHPSATSCDSKVPIVLNDGGSCKSEEISADFFTIGCEEKIDTKFNPGSLSVIAGQGFGFSVNVQSVKTCDGVFYDQIWKEYYNNAKTNRDNSKEAADYNTYNNIMKDLENAVALYNTWNMEDTTTPTGEMKLDYSLKDGSPVSESYNFVSTQVSAGESNYTTSTELKLGVSGLTNPRNFTYSNAGKPRVYSLTPPRAYLDYHGAVSGTGTVDGGNKFYTNTNAMTGTAKMHIEIKNLGGDKKSSVTNDACEVNLDETSMIYRPIDVGNPFINEKREKGENWVNENFNYTSTIDDKVWTGKALYVFDLSSETINEIKESNNKNSKAGENNGVANEYLGTCKDKTQSSSDIVCEIIGN